MARPRNLSKEEARRLNHASFSAAVEEFRKEHTLQDAVEEFVKQDTPGGTTPMGNPSVTVYVRKRPLLPHEEKAKEIDAITCLNDHQIVLHDAQMDPDMVHMRMYNRWFSYNRVFSEMDDNDAVYQYVLADLVREVASKGVTATSFVFGATGSGKTYTMSAMYKKAAQDVFRRKSRRVHKVTVTLIEIQGRICRDLLNGKERQLLEDEEGQVHVHGVTACEVDSAGHMLDVVQDAMELRAQAATGVHDVSSRSHAVFRTELWDQEEKVIGRLDLIDLAGSERKKDIRGHDVLLAKESRDINQSLSVLKDCFRAINAGDKYIPFRGTVLTRLLQTTFSHPDGAHRGCIIVTLSPVMTDFEHSYNTCRHALVMSGKKGVGFGAEKSGEERVDKVVVEDVVLAKAREQRLEMGVPPQRWSNEQVVSWWSFHSSSDPPSSINGSMLVRMSKARFAQLGDATLFDKLKDFKRDLAAKDKERRQTIRSSLSKRGQAQEMRPTRKKVKGNRKGFKPSSHHEKDQRYAEEMLRIMQSREAK